MTREFNALFRLNLSRFCRDIVSGNEENYICFDVLASLYSPPPICEDDLEKNTIIYSYPAEIYVVVVDGKPDIIKKDESSNFRGGKRLSKDEATVFRVLIEKEIRGKWFNKQELLSTVDLFIESLTPNPRP